MNSNKIITVVIASLIGIFFIWFFFKGIYHISYWIYYKPFYAIFNNSLYLPFYLYILKHLPLIILFFVISIITKRWYKLIPIAIMIVLVGIGYFNVIKDITFINKEKYTIGEFDVNTIREGSNKNAPRYVMSSPNDMYSIVEMNVYQYKKLVLLKEPDEYGFKKKIIKVYFLPNTNIMLKYEEGIIKH